MIVQTAQNLLSALCGNGSNTILRRVTIGLDAPETLRQLSDARQLTCPGCGATVVLHAGTVRAHHFAHLPGAVCSLPQTEPETEAHRSGKLLLASWLRARLPEAEILLEAAIPETGQRADVLIVLPGTRTPRRIALEFQCANLSAREWRRRHRLYRDAGLEDLWLLGGSRLERESEGNRGVTTLRTTDLERALLWDSAPLLFLDSLGDRLPAGTLARFRPDEDAQALHPTGRLSARPLDTLEFPWPLLDWPAAAHPAAPIAERSLRHAPQNPDRSSALNADLHLWDWLAQRHRVTPETLDPLFGLPLAGREAFLCEARLWQAAIYYRFVHRRVGDGWWLTEVETWTRAYLPLARPMDLRKLRRALAEWQEALAAAGLLSLPMGYGRVNARILADLSTLPAPPDPETTLRLARYRRTLTREK